MGQGVNLTILDNQLGQSAPGQGQTEVVIGVGSGGLVPNFTPYTTSSLSNIKGNSGVGPGPRLAAFIAQQTGNPVEVCTVPAASNGTVSAVFTTSTNTGTGTVAISGNPNDDYYLFISYPTGGVALGTVGNQIGISLDGGATIAFTYNLNAGQTTITTGSTFTAYTGLTLTLGGTPVTGDSFYAVCTAPTWNDAGILSALQAVAAVKAQSFQDVMVAGGSSAGTVAGSAGVAPADVTAFDGYMTTLANSNRRFSRLLCGARDAVWGGTSTETQAAWITSLQGQFATTASTRVGVCAGHYRFLDPFTQSQLRSNLLYGAAARDAGVNPSIDLGEVDLGGLPNLVLPATPDAFANGKFFYNDDDVTPGLDSARFMAAWQLVQFPGLYIKNSNLMAPPGSDFNWLQHGHVIDEASQIVYAYFTKQLSRPVRVSLKTGFILPQDQAKLQQGCQGQLNIGIGNQTSGVVCVVSGNDPILSNATLTVYIYVVPFAYIKNVNAIIGLFNPANTLSFQAVAMAA